MGKLEIFMLIVSLNLLLCSAGPPISSWYDEDTAVENSVEERDIATIQAGSCACQLTLYDRPNYGGRSVLFEGQNPDFAYEWYHDRAESAKVTGPCTWLAYENYFYGHFVIIEENNIPDLGTLKNMLSSARALPPKNSGAAIAIFEHPNYGGRMVVFYASNSDLNSVDFDNHMSSFIVIAGTWVLYTERNYYGNRITYEAGFYSTEPGPIGHDTLSSVKLENYYSAVN